jgi:meso-butanediol dehydrogenase/(S,S)-butanediol dehydrogenase/diacetyl reductase
MPPIENAMWNMQGKLVVVTGAGNGIGRGTARLFSKEGAIVVLVDVDEAAGHDTQREITQEGGQALFLQVDVSRSEEVAKMAETVLKLHGHIDVLFANAAVQLSCPAADTEEQDWDRLHAINLKGVFLCCKHVIPAMRKQGKGAIVITSSGHALVTYPNCSAYASTKGALVALTRGLALDYASAGIRVNCVLPGTTDTRLVRDYIESSSDPQTTRHRLIERIPLGRFATPEDIGRAVLFLASDYASFITGTNLIVDGGQLAQG